MPGNTPQRAFQHVRHTNHDESSYLLSPTYRFTDRRCPASFTHSVHVDTSNPSLLLASLAEDVVDGQKIEEIVKPLYVFVAKITGTPEERPNRAWGTSSAVAQ